MASDVLALGGFAFEGFAAPERLPSGGRQALIVHRMPGGSRAIDCMGADDAPRRWSGWFYSDTALQDALTLDAMRISGAPLPLSNFFESRIVVIEEFNYRAVKVDCIEYDITVVPADGGETGGGFGGLAALVASDLGAALGLL